MDRIKDLLMGLAFLFFAVLARLCFGPQIGE